jgi:hypothetical protein
MINAFYQEGAMSKEMYNDFRAVFQKMWNPNFMERISDTDMLLNMYEHVLVKTGIMYRAQSVFENHEIKNINDVGTETATPSSLPGLIPLDLLKFVKQQRKKCPKGTRKNKKTGNCEAKPMAKPQVSMANASVSPIIPLTPSLTPIKRCPKGSHRNKLTGHCGNVQGVILKRCPNGTRRKTGLCEPK